jgi:hypothetical protein
MATSKKYISKEAVLNRNKRTRREELKMSKSRKCENWKELGFRILILGFPLVLSSGFQLKPFNLEIFVSLGPSVHVGRIESWVLFASLVFHSWVLGVQTTTFGFSQFLGLMSYVSVLKTFHMSPRSSTYPRSSIFCLPQDLSFPSNSARPSVYLVS